MNGLTWSFGTEGCCLTFWMFCVAWHGAISTGRRKGNEWVYIAAGVMGGGGWNSQRYSARRGVTGMNALDSEMKCSYGNHWTYPLVRVELDRLNVGARNADQWMETRRVWNRKTAVPRALCWRKISWQLVSWYWCLEQSGFRPDPKAKLVAHPLIWFDSVCSRREVYRDAHISAWIAASWCNFR